MRYYIVDDKGNCYSDFDTLAEACKAFAWYIRKGIDIVTIIQE